MCSVFSKREVAEEKLSTADEHLKVMNRSTKKVLQRPDTGPER